MRQWKVIGKGHSGWHADAGNMSSSSYDPGDDRRDAYVAEAAEGCLVYDASEADADAFVRFVLGGPMCKPGLEAPEVFGAEDRKRALSMCGPGGLTGGFDTLVYLEAAQAAAPGRKFSGFGGLDQVPPAVYAALLRKHVPGTKIGHVENGVIVWEALTEAGKDTE